MGDNRLTREEMVTVGEYAVMALIANHRAEFDHLISEAKKAFKEKK